MYTAVAEMLGQVDHWSGFETHEEASAAAYAMAWDLYYSYEGLHGVGVEEEINNYIEEHGEEPTDDEEDEMRYQDFESWASYWVVEGEYEE